MLTRLLATLLVVSTLFAPHARAQKPKPNHPSQNPYCSPTDTALMEAAGIVSFGGFPFGKKGNDTAKVDAFLPEAEIRWIETPHFKIGFALGPTKVKLEDKKKVIAELTRLSKVLPKVEPEMAILDPWLRLHMYAQRCEDIYARFLQIVNGTQESFSDGSGSWSGSYRGEGPYLGQKSKYEVLILPNEAMHVAFLVENAGLHIRKTQRWHYVETGAIAVMIHATQGNLRQDPALHGHVAFNLVQNLFDGLNHYSYDTPVWIHEGLAHVLEREIDPNNNSFDGGEGAVAEMTSKGDWKPEVLKLLGSLKAPRMAELMQLKNYGELKLPHHFTTWSMTEFLMKTKPEEFARFLWSMKQCYGPDGLPSGENFPEWHRKKFKEILGWNYPEFDDAWRSWAMTVYKPGPKKEGGDMGPLAPGGGITTGG